MMETGKKQWAADLLRINTLIMNFLMLPARLSFEIRRYTRAYTLPGVFTAGDYAPPMKDVADWIKNKYQD